MIKVQKLVSEFAKKYKLDPRVVNAVLRSPFLFVDKVFADDDDYRPIMLPYWGKYVLKPRFREGVKNGE